MTSSWNDRIDAFWESADDTRPAEMRQRLDALLAERPVGDAAADFERASLHDFLGDARRAIPLYRAALAAGLDPERRAQAVIQLASSLRAIGDAGGAVRLLEDAAPGPSTGDAARAFLALALHDTGRHGQALQTALRALAPTLPRYGRAVAAYADELAATPAPERIRSIAVGLVVRDGHALVEIYPERSHHGLFARALGGGIDFGETALDAVRREFAEELGVSVSAAVPLAITENIFERDGRRGHEIVHVFRVASTELDRLPLDAEVPLLDNDTVARWIPLELLRAGDPPFYPAGIVDLATALDEAS